jgi:biotin carboxylase
MSNPEFVLFICGGKWQLPWFRFLKNKGLKVALVDPYPDSLCVSEADVFIQCDARDTEEIYRKVMEMGLQISFVTSEQTDVSSLPVAQISEKLGLFANPVHVVERFANKFINRQFFAENQLGHAPLFSRVHNWEELTEFQKRVSRKLIIKPVDAQSSRGIFLLDSAEMLQGPALFEQALSFSKESFLIAEEFIEGHEVTVEGFCNDGKHQVLAISDKKHFRTGIASELKYPARFNIGLQGRLTEFHNRLIEKMGLIFGITHAEYLINEEKNDFWLVEVACRGGGSLIPSHIVPWVSGFPVYDTLYECARNQGRAGNPALLSLPKHAILYFFEFPNGRVLSIKGDREVEMRPDVFSFGLEFRTGDRIQAANDDRSRQGYVIVKGETETDLLQRLEEIKKQLVVEMEY